MSHYSVFHVTIFQSVRQIYAWKLAANIGALRKSSEDAIKPKARSAADEKDKKLIKKRFLGKYVDPPASYNCSTVSYNRNPIIIVMATL